MKMFEVFCENKKIAELAEFSDGYGYLHYLIDTFPQNEWGRIRTLKKAITKAGWIYKTNNSET